MKKRVWSLLLCMLLCLSLLPTGVLAADDGTVWHGVEIDLGDLDLKTCASTVAYAGYEWVIIGDGQDKENGLHLGDENCITLLLKTTSIEGIGSPVLFRAAYSPEEYENLSEEAQAQYKKHEGTHANASGGSKVTAYYAKNTLEGLEDWTHPNEYAGSTVQQTVEAATYEIPAKERAYIVTRDFEGSTGSDTNGVSKDGIAGQGIKGQHLWLLSREEWDKVRQLEGIETITQGSRIEWWLRSPDDSHENCKNTCGFYASLIGQNNDPAAPMPTFDQLYVDEVNETKYYYYSRPALILSLPDASDILMLTQTGDPYAADLANKNLGKDQAKTGGDFIPLKRPDTTTDRLKLTVQDDMQSLTLSAPENLTVGADGKLTLAYAFTHISPKIDTQGEFYLSCMIRNEQGELMGYARLAKPGQGVEGKGSVTVNLKQIQEGAQITLTHGETYSFFFFTEEVSGPLYTDFASKPVEVKITIGADDAFAVDRGDVNTHAAIDGNKSASYDKADSGNLPTFSLNLGGNRLVTVMNGENTLKKDENYTITDAKPASAPTTAQFLQTERWGANDTQSVAFSESYLNSLGLGEHTFTFVMSCGPNPTVDITISNTGSNSRPPTPPNENDGSGGDDSGGSNDPTYYTLTFETNGGSEIDRITDTYGATINLSGYKPIRKGYVFTGWYADEAMTEKITSIRLNGNRTVYAGWGKDNSDGYADCPRDKTCPASHFTDLNLNAWYHDGIHFCVERSLMVGTSTTTFSPDLTTSRAMIATILWRQAGNPVVNYAMNFGDVDTSAWYGEAVRWAASEGIVSGYGNGKFGSNDPITREQLAVMLYNYEKNRGGNVKAAANLSDNTDASQISAWALDALRWAVSEGIVGGTSSIALSPKGQATRAQTAAILMRYLDK